MLGKYMYTDAEIKEILESITIICDTREKVSKHILNYFDKKKIAYVIKKLDYGDYSFYVPKNENLGIMKNISFKDEIAIERKANLEELSGNLAQQRDRFEKELSTYKGKLHLLIENASYHDICEGNYNTDYNKKSYLGSLHSFSNKYAFDIMFMPNNQYSGVFIYYTFCYFLRQLIK